ncbi:unnamed protein product [Orchesella dallaii]|uniref:Uncharacterized protein n=1 Tax=Orchesella dallaii TaxID=48710 RepID=A0ABP1RZ72_9HEXA
MGFSMRIGRRFNLILFFLLVSGSASSIKIEEVNEDQSTVVLSRGAVINPLDGVMVYDQLEQCFFLLPDIPEPPSLTDVKCSDGMDEKLCNLFEEQKQVLRDIQAELKITNRVLTTKGLGDQNAFVPSKVNRKWFETVPFVDVHSATPNQEIKEAAGNDYLSDVEMRLALRKILETGGTRELDVRQKRAVLPFLIPAFKFASKALASSQLQDFFKGFFTGDNGILSTLAAFRASSPADRKAFTELSKRVSEFETETKKLFIDVLSKTDDIEKTINELQNDHYELSNNIVGFKELVLSHQSLISDLSRLIYVSNIYAMHFQAFSDCRSGKISPTFIPLSLLSEKLRDLETKMPSDKTLLFSSAEAFRYYTLTLAECIYDSRGGLVKIGIPLRKKQSAFHVYEYKPIQFAYNDFTCSLETPATHVIKDLNSNDVFPITELEAESCDVSTGLCRLPMSTDMDTSSICIAILLKGSSANLIRENCKFHCSKRSIADISEISEDVFVGIHLPPRGIEIRCPGETIPLSSEVAIGSHRFSLICTMCSLYWNNRLVASSSGVPCKDERRPVIETLLPIQFSVLKDVKPDGDDGIEKTVFTGTEEIINSKYDPETGTTIPPLSILPGLFTSLGVFWDFMQSLAILYIYYRNRFIPNPLGVVLNNMIPGVAADRYTCQLSDDVYIMLWTILIVNLAALVPSMLYKVYRFFYDLYNDSVEAAALRQEVDRQLAHIP